MEAKPFSLQSPEKVAGAYGGNKQKIAQAIQMGTLDPTSGLLAGMLIDRIRSAQAMERAPQQTVAQQVFAPPAPPAPPGGLGAIGPQGGMAPPAAPVGMAAGGMTELPASSNGGLTTLPLPDDMYNEESFAGGGIVAFAGGRKVDARAEQIKALMAVATDPDSSPEDRMAARVALNKLEGMGPGRTPGPGLADALAYTYEGPRGMDLLNQLDKATGAPVGGTRMDPSGYKEPPANLFRNAEAAQRGPRIMDFLNRLDEATGAPVGGTRMDPSGYKEPPANLFRNAEAAQRGPQVDFGAMLPDQKAFQDRLATLEANKDSRSRFVKDAEGVLVPAAKGVAGVAGYYGDVLENLRDSVLKRVGPIALANAGISAKNYFSPQDSQTPFLEQFKSRFEDTPSKPGAVSPPTPSNAKSDLGRVNMGGYDPNRSSPEAQLAAILGRSPTPEATELDALLGRTETAPVRADTAPTRIPGAGRRTGAGAATTRPTSSTAPAAGTTPEMSDEEFKAKARRDYEEAAKLPAPKGTTAEEKAARKNEDLWSALAQIGFGMAAGESPNFLTNVGKATAAAVPGMQEALKERRADTKEELKQRYAYELAQAGVKGDAYKFSMDRFDKLEDNRYRKSSLAELTRHNQQMERLQGQQIAASAANQKTIQELYKSNTFKQKVEDLAAFLQREKGVSRDAALVTAAKMLTPGFLASTRTGSTSNVQDTLKRVKGFVGSEDGNTPQLPAGYELDE